MDKQERVYGWDVGRKKIDVYPKIKNIRKKCSKDYRLCLRYN